MDIDFLQKHVKRCKFSSCETRQKVITLEFTHFLTSNTHLTPMDKGEGAFS